METLKQSLLIIIFNNEKWKEDSALQKQLFSVFRRKLTNRNWKDDDRRSLRVFNSKFL